jgi:hypothetical protein
MKARPFWTDDAAEEQFQVLTNEFDPKLAVTRKC